MKFPWNCRHKAPAAGFTAFDPPASELEKVACAAREKLIDELDDDLRALAAQLGWRQGGLDDIISAQMIRCARPRSI